MKKIILITIAASLCLTVTGCRTIQRSWYSSFEQEVGQEIQKEVNEVMREIEKEIGMEIEKEIRHALEEAGNEIREELKDQDYRDDDDLRTIEAIAWEEALAGFDEIGEDEGDTVKIEVFDSSNEKVLLEIMEKKAINQTFMDMKMSTWTWVDQHPDHLGEEYRLTAYNRAAGVEDQMSDQLREQIYFQTYEGSSYVKVKMAGMKEAWFLASEESLIFMREIVDY